MYYNSTPMKYLYCADEVEEAKIRTVDVREPIVIIKYVDNEEGEVDIVDNEEGEVDIDGYQEEQQSILRQQLLCSKTTKRTSTSSEQLIRSCDSPQPSTSGQQTATTNECGDNDKRTVSNNSEEMPTNKDRARVHEGFLGPLSEEIKTINVAPKQISATHDPLPASQNKLPIQDPKPAHLQLVARNESPIHNQVELVAVQNQALARNEAASHNRDQILPLGNLIGAPDALAVLPQPAFTPAQLAIFCGNVRFFLQACTGTIDPNDPHWDGIHNYLHVN